MSDGTASISVKYADQLSVMNRMTTELQDKLAALASVPAKDLNRHQMRAALSQVNVLRLRLKRMEVALRRMRAKAEAEGVVFNEPA